MTSPTSSIHSISPLRTGIKRTLSVDELDKLVKTAGTNLSQKQQAKDLYELSHRDELGERMPTPTEDVPRMEARNRVNEDLENAQSSYNYLNASWRARNSSAASLFEKIPSLSQEEREIAHTKSRIERDRIKSELLHPLSLADKNYYTGVQSWWEKVKTETKPKRNFSFSSSSTSKKSSKKNSMSDMFKSFSLGQSSSRRPSAVEGQISNPSNPTKNIGVKLERAPTPPAKKVNN